MTYVNCKQTGANGVLLTTAHGSYPVGCPEDIARLLPPKGTTHVITKVPERSDTPQQLSLFELEEAV